ncbi:putative glucosylceramidase 4 [Nilaparvata lugens]|uniref:putative glucosylceramidase 4 n=1 Tax=Nilaparvata lugens TaxID=108931 RepID=UPI000B98C586|nr:putative glucosylceramidase 4 [Nilaparvata lugens]XP_039276893.1 putative glucosylceramidase 4 [Nilaparvata lugens]
MYVIQINVPMLLLMMILIFEIAYCGTPCEQRFTKYGFVCVCNSTYCDTIRRPDRNPEDVDAILHYTTSKDGKVLELSHGSFNEPISDDEGCHIIIDAQKKYQEIIGFGTAFTDAAGINAACLSESAQHHLISAYYGPEGIGFVMGRVPIGGTDFSTRAYTLDDIKDDFELSHFSLAPEDYDYKMPYMKKAMEISPKEIKWLCSAWSAPPWTKTNNKITGFGFLKKEFYRLWAQYHIRFLEEYKKHNFTFWGTTCGNEPLNAYLPFLVRFNSMGWHPSDQGEWVAQYLGPMLKESYGPINIIALDDQRFMMKFWEKMLAKAKDYVDGIGLHWYYDEVTPASCLTTFHEKHPNLLILGTEACAGYLPWDAGVKLGSWKRGSRYMEDIIENINHWMCCWIDWNFALDENGAPNWVKNFVDSAIIVNCTRGEFYKQPMFYALAHLSAFNEPGAVRIGMKMTSQPFYKLECRDVAALVMLNQHGGRVLVLNNKASSSRTVIVEDRMKGKKAKMSLEPHSFHTILYRH